MGLLASNSVHKTLRLVLFFFMPSLIICSGEPNFMVGSCIGGNNYTKISPYYSNLLTAFSNLTSLSSIKTFADVVVGSEENRQNNVYALFDCRGDVSLNTCRGCVEEASKKLFLRCLTKGGIVFYEECMLRYADHPIISKMELGDPLLKGCSDLSVPDNNKELKRIIESKFNDLINEATSENSTRYFALGERNYGVYQKIYFWVQCTPDISRDECKECLIDALMNNTLLCTNAGRLTGVMNGPSCRNRYDFEPFYNFSSGNPPVISPTARSTTSDGGSSFLLIEKLSILFSTLFLFLTFINVRI